MAILIPAISLATLVYSIFPKSLEIREHYLRLSTTDPYRQIHEIKIESRETQYLIDRQDIGRKKYYEDLKDMYSILDVTGRDTLGYEGRIWTSSGNATEAFIYGDRLTEEETKKRETRLLHDTYSLVTHAPRRYKAEKTQREKYRKSGILEEEDIQRMLEATTIFQFEPFSTKYPIDRFRERFRSFFPQEFRRGAENRTIEHVVKTKLGLGITKANIVAAALSAIVFFGSLLYFGESISATVHNIQCSDKLRELFASYCYKQRMLRM